MTLRKNGTKKNKVPKDEEGTMWPLDFGSVLDFAEAASLQFKGIKDLHDRMRACLVQIQDHHEEVHDSDFQSHITSEVAVSWKYDE
ncbi:hypothetical protein FS837_003536, partial [Tulasnella sp. UAMH 9824]